MPPTEAAIVAHRARGGRLVVALLFMLMAATRAAAAQQPPDPRARAEAKQHYERAKQLVQREAFAEAAEEFRKAYETAPHVQVLYNLGQCYVALGRPVEALDALARYLTQVAPTLTIARREAVEKEMEEQRAKTAEVVLSVQPTNAQVTIDGVPGPVDSGQPLRLALGEHTVSASAPDHISTERRFTLTAQQVLPVTIELGRISPQRSPAPSAIPDPLQRTSASVTTREQKDERQLAAAARARTRRLIAYATAGTGLAVAAAGLIVYLDNDQRFKDWQSRQRALDDEWKFSSEGPVTPAGLDARQSANEAAGRSILARDRTALLLGAGGGALVITGVVIFLTGLGEAPRRVSVAVGHDRTFVSWYQHW